VVAATAALIRFGIGAFVAAHPMHTSVIELVENSSSHAVVVILRVFADDFGTVVPDRGPAGAEAYVRSHLELTGARGSPVPLRWGGATLSGDVVQIRLSAQVPGGLGGTRVRAALMCERFPDQVNIVRATYGGRTASLLFTRGDPAKALP